jgi:hypothetical protein
VERSITLFTVLKLAMIAIGTRLAFTGRHD